MVAWSRILAPIASRFEAGADQLELEPVIAVAQVPIQPVYSLLVTNDDVHKPVIVVIAPGGIRTSSR